MSAILPFETTFFEQGKTLDLSIQPEILYTGDENRIKQIIIILIDNAIKHTDKGDSINVNLSMQGGKRVLVVKNTGEGIPQKDIPHIFERFYRVDSSRNRDTGGFGLGLAIAQSIAEAHHGKLTVASKEGEFTEFTLIL